jgi:hypothetical protein
LGVEAFAEGPTPGHPIQLLVRAFTEQGAHMSVPLSACHRTDGCGLGTAHNQRLNAAASAWENKRISFSSRLNRSLETDSSQSGTNIGCQSSSGSIRTNVGHNDVMPAAALAASLLMQTPLPRLGATRMCLKGRVMAKHKFRARPEVKLAANAISRHAGGRYVPIIRRLFTKRAFGLFGIRDSREQLAREIRICS